MTEQTPEELEARRAAMRASCAHMTCEVCQRDKTLHPVIGVASSSLGAISFAFCEECARKPAEPFFMFCFSWEMTDGHVADWVKNLFTYHKDRYLCWCDFAALSEEEKFPNGRTPEPDVEPIEDQSEEPDFGDLPTFKDTLS